MGTPFEDLRATDPASVNAFIKAYLPGFVGMEFLSLEPERVRARLPIRQELMAPNQFLHAASLVALLDTCCGFGTVVNLPEGASGFTTMELKSNFLGTLRQGEVHCEAVPVHIGRNTQLWDATASDPETGRKLALFRCTQMILYPK